MATNTAGAACDPCLVRERGTSSECGWVGRTLSSHVKAHSGWTIDKYRKKFPNANVGLPANRPSPENIEALQAARQSSATDIVEAQSVSPEEQQTRISTRAEVLWNLVERDPASEVLCRTLAADEVALEDAQEQANRFTRAGEYDKLQKLNKAINDIADRVIKAQQALGVTADQRRRNNQIGADAGCQIISNYTNVLRKMATPARAAFLRRTQVFVDANWQRVNDEYLSKVEDDLDGQTGNGHEPDYRTLILSRAPTV